MRTEQEMFDLILNTAREDSRIRAVWMNGSRANPNARQDRYMDFDIVYAVSVLEPFRDPDWIGRFGEICVMQDPDGSPFFAPEEDYRLGQRQTWLMQFADGNRIDLTLLRMDAALSQYGSESQTVLLLDKDSRFPPITPSDRDFRLVPPTQEGFSACCNEFWWLVPYSAKGLARSVLNPGELLYARSMFENHIRGELDRMLGWRIGAERGFSVSLGKCIKELPSFVSAGLWERYLGLFPDCTAASIRRSLLLACELFSGLSAEVASAFGFAQNLREAENSRTYTEYLTRELTGPKTEESICCTTPRLL